MRLVVATMLCLMGTSATAPAQDTFPPDRDTRLIQQVVSPTVTARATASAPAQVRYRARAFIQRRAPSQAEAATALDAAIAAARSAGAAVVTRDVRKNGAMIVIDFQRPRAQPPTLDSAPATIPPARAWQESASMEVESTSREALLEWSRALLASQPGDAMQQQAPLISEVSADDDPAWATATQAALRKAELDARTTAIAAGGDLGALLRVSTERKFPSDGMVSVQITAEYAMRAGTRR